MKSTESTWIKVLSDAEIEKINEQSLQILRRPASWWITRRA